MTKSAWIWLGWSLALASVGAAAQTVTGSGTTNTVPVFTGSSTVGNSPISVSGSNVGIGTTSPQFALDVSGQARLQSPANIDLAALGSDNAIYIRSAQYDAFSGFTGGGLTNVNDTANGASLGYVAKFSYGWTAVSTVNRTTGFGPGIYDVYVRIRSDGTGDDPNGVSLGIYDLTTGTYPLSASVPITTSYQELYLGRVTIAAASLGDGMETYFSVSGITTNYYLDYVKFVKAPLFMGGYVGIGTTAPYGQLNVFGAGQATQNAFSTTGALGGTLYLQDSGGGAYNGGTIMFGAGQGAFAAIKGLLTNGTNNTVGDIAIATRQITTASTLTDALYIQNSGNVGIGTTAPSAKLEVDGNVKLTSGSGATLTFQDGTVQTTAFTGVLCGGDYAESVDVTGNRTNYEPGDVLVLDADNPGKILKSIEAYSTAVSGIYSTKPGTVGRRQTTAKSPDEVPMAVVGIVPAKVSAENGPVKVGDLLVTSSTPGYAMKGTDRSRMLGAVVGKAMGSLDSGTGVIEVLVTLQ
jgi:hypothetical protein